MELANDTSKAIAKAVELLHEYLDKNDIYEDGLLNDAISILEKALDKIIVKM